MEISNYTIIERDGVVIAYATLNVYASEKMAEMACVAVYPDYRNSSPGDIFLENIQKREHYNYQYRSKILIQNLMEH